MSAATPVRLENPKTTPEPSVPHAVCPRLRSLSYERWIRGHLFHPAQRKDDGSVPFSSFKEAAQWQDERERRYWRRATEAEQALGPARGFVTAEDEVSRRVAELLEDVRQQEEIAARIKRELREGLVAPGWIHLAKSEARRRRKEAKRLRAKAAPENRSALVAEIRREEGARHKDLGFEYCILEVRLEGTASGATDGAWPPLLELLREGGAKHGGGSSPNGHLIRTGADGEPEIDEVILHERLRGVFDWGMPGPMCWLTEEWDFQSIASRAWIHAAHRSKSWTAGADWSDLLRQCLEELETEARRRHPFLTQQDRLHLLGSWQTHRHLDAVAQQMEKRGDPNAIQQGWKELVSQITATVGSFANAMQAAASLEATGESQNAQKSTVPASVSAPVAEGARPESQRRPNREQPGEDRMPAQDRPRASLDAPPIKGPARRNEGRSSVSSDTGEKEVPANRFPVRAKWVEDQLRDQQRWPCSFSKEKGWIGPHRKTMRTKILMGLGIGEVTLDRLAEGVSWDNRTFHREDIPDN